MDQARKELALNFLVLLKMYVPAAIRHDTQELKHKPSALRRLVKRPCIKRQISLVGDLI
jgi:hypothetical protein